MLLESILIIVFGTNFGFEKTIFYFISIYFSLILLKFAHWIYSVAIRKRKNLIAEYGANSWVMITGATDGIGKAFAEEFSRIGFNIILVSRSEEKLIKVSNEIRDINPNVKVTIIPFDFSIKTKSEEYEEKFNPFRDYDISVLVNNVGITMKDKYDNLPIDEVKQYINLNLIPQSYLTKIFIDKMLNRSKRSAIINLSSTASTFAAPNRFSLYGATKIFNDYLSHALNAKNKEKIDFLSIKPLMVESSQTNYVKNGITVITARQCVNGCLDSLGYENETNGHWIHQIQGFMLRSIPEKLYLIVSGIAVAIMKKNKSK